jgi:glycosyltransferase involved in cell wall biosynthesis
MNQKPETKPIIKKVMIVTNIPNPYRIPLFNEINNQLSARGITLIVLFGARGYSRRMFKLDIQECGFDYQILNNWVFKLGKNKKTWFTYGGLLKSAGKLNPDKIIIIGYSWGTVKLWLRSFFKKTDYIIWSGSTLHPYRKISFLRKIERRLMVSRASGFIAYGSKAREYLIGIGAKPDKVFIAINTVDTDFFVNKTREYKEKLKVKKSRKYLTYIGYLIPRKNVFRLLEIVEVLLQKRDDFILDIIGDGSDRKGLEKMALEKNLTPHIRFLGFKQKEELPRYLARSSCFLFQTDYDIWGLVLNEAMAAGVPCIASVHAGASVDLIQEEKTGFISDFADVTRVVKQIDWILSHPEKAEKMGMQASEFIQKQASLLKSARGFLSVLKYI